MTTYQRNTLGTSASTIEENDDRQDDAIRSHEYGDVEPPVKFDGLLWWCVRSGSTTSILSTAGCPGSVNLALLRYDATATQWKFMAPSTPWLAADGSVTVTQNLPMNTKVFTGLGAGTANGQSVRFEQALKKNTGGTVFDAEGKKITNGVAGVDPTDFVIMSQIPSAGNIVAGYYQTNRDVLSNSKPVKWVIDGSESTTFTELPWTPRRMALRLHGRFRRQTDNGEYSGSGAGHNTGAAGIVIPDIYRWNSQSVGGDDGNSSDYFLVHSISTAGTGVDLDIWVKWKYASTGVPAGFWLKFQYSDGASEYANLKKIDNSGVDGVVHVLAEYPSGM